MVPVIWALFSADVNAGTASAARIAIIAITTSSSISVNAEESLFFIFILGFCFCVVLRVPARRNFTRRRVFQRVLFWGFALVFCWVGFGGLVVRIPRFIAVFTDSVNTYILFFF